MRRRVFIKGFIKSSYASAIVNWTTNDALAGNTTAIERYCRALDPSAYRLILAEIPLADRKNEIGDPNDRSLNLALLSETLQLHVVQRPSSVVMFRRYADPREHFLVDIEEMKWVTNSLLMLLSPFAVDAPGDQSITDRIRFVQTLSVAQQRRMINGGLPLAELLPSQRQLWQRVNTYQAFANKIRQLVIARNLMTGWEASELVYLNRSVQGQNGGVSVKRGLWWKYPHPEPGDAGHKETLSVPQNVSRESSNWVRGNVGPSFEKLAARDVRLESVGGPPIREQARIQTLREVCEPVSKALGVRIKLPPYIASRRVFGRFNGVSARVVLGAIEELTNHTWTRDSSGALVFARPIVKSVTNVIDLMEAMRRVLPPCFKYVWNEEGEEARVTRRILQYQSFRSEIDAEKGKDWEKVRSKELSKENTRRWAGWLVERHLRIPIEDFALRSVPYAWIAAPERGFFTLTGEVLPGQHPLLEFHVPRPDGKVDAWGWFVGTSSLDRD